MEKTVTQSVHVELLIIKSKVFLKIQKVYSDTCCVLMSAFTAMFNPFVHLRLREDPLSADLSLFFFTLKGLKHWAV